MQAARKLASQVDLDWDRLGRAARREGLDPLLYHIVHGQDLVPPPVEQAWQQVYYLNILHDTRLFHQLQDLLAHLAAADVPVILLKGAALAETVYGSAAVRPMKDLDLLVPVAEAGCAQTVLASLNYAMLSPDPWPGFSQRYGNSLAYEHPSLGTPSFLIGLHWQLLGIPYYERIPVQEWFARAQPASVGGVEALVPAPEDHLVYLCGHLALHHRYVPSLFRYHDMAALIHHTGDALDWRVVMRRALHWWLVIPLQRTLARLEELWPGTVPAEVVQEVVGLRPTRAECWIHRWVVDRPRNPTSYMVLSLATMPGLRRRVRFVLEQAFPSPAYMRQRYCPEHPGLWPLTYGQRVGLALRYLLRRLRRPRFAASVPAYHE